MKWLVVAACACTRPPAPAATPIANAAPSSLVAIDRVAPLAIAAVPGAKRDCRPSQVIRRRFAGQAVTPCNTSECVERALADGQPFLLETTQQGIDSTIAYGLVGAVDAGELVAYYMLFDSDPCGGSCPDRGSTTIDRCTRLVRDITHPDACAVNVTQCFRCDGARTVERCEFGR